MFAYDSAIQAAIQTPAQSIGDVLQILQTIDSICIDRDGLKWFNRLYLQVTAAVQTRVSAGGFHNPVWLADLDVQFANIYFLALQNSLAGRKASGCWRALFECRQQNAVARIQFALAGVNAHINHDLPEAIVATCQANGTSPDRGGALYQDYSDVNSTLDSLIELAKSELMVRLPGDALPAVNHVEDTIAAWSVCAARESAWQNAEYLWAVRALPAASAGFLNMLDGFTTVIGKALLVPAP